jgi:threonine dehydrogenase-like Zn-dependent dehydrogenase
LAFYEGEGRGLRLGEEWHMNRITMRSSRACSDPNRDHPRWDNRRLRELAFRLLKEGALTAEGLVTPIVGIDQAAEAYQDIDRHPERSIKMGVKFA